MIGQTRHKNLVRLLGYCDEGEDLESTDAAPGVPHPRPTRRDAGRGVRRGCPRVGPRLGFFFFFFFSDSRRLGSIRADAARFVPNRLLFAPNRADSSKIGPYRPYRTYRPAADTANTAETGRKSAETGRKQAETGRKRLKSALSMAVKSETCILLSFFVNQGLVCVFKKYFNSKNIYKI